MTEPFVVFGYGSLIFKVSSTRFTYAQKRTVKRIIFLSLRLT